MLDVHFHLTKIIQRIFCLFNPVERGYIFVLFRDRDSRCIISSAFYVPDRGIKIHLRKVGGLKKKTFEVARTNCVYETCRGVSENTMFQTKNVC